MSNIGTNIHAQTHARTLVPCSKEIETELLGLSSISLSELCSFRMIVTLLFVFNVFHVLSKINN